MKNSFKGTAENSACPASLYRIHSTPIENTSEECIPESGRVSVPLFIKRRLLCALRERRQGNPALAPDHGSRVSTTRPRLVKTRARANRPRARKAHARRALRSLLGNDATSKAENHRAKNSHHPP